MAITVNNPRIGWHTLAVAGTLSADSEQADFPALNLANPATYLQWRAAENIEQSLTISLPTPQAINYVGVYGHNWGSLGTTVRLEYSTDGGVVWLPASPPTIPDLEDRVFFREFTEVVAANFRVRLIPSGDLYDNPPEASVLYIGRVLTIPRRVYVGHEPMTLARSANVSTGFSENGQFLGRVLLSIALESSVSIPNLDPDFVRDELDPFIRTGIGRPFFWAWRPGRYQEEVTLAWFTREAPKPSNQKENGTMSVAWSMRGVTQPPHLR